jgi:hypothetical protein
MKRGEARYKLIVSDERKPKGESNRKDDEHTVRTIRVKVVYEDRGPGRELETEMID